MIITAKLTKRKLAGLILVVLVCAVSIALLVTGCSGKDSPDLSENEQRVSFLQSLGWQVSQEAVKIQQVNIPETMNETLARYNDIQMQQGFDLNEHLGKTATRYVYEITNYPQTEGEVFATLLICDGKLIAADFSCWDEDGFCKPLLQAQE